MKVTFIWTSKVGKTLNGRTINYRNGSSKKAISSISTRNRFDWNKEKILEEWNDLTKNIEADIVVLYMPLLNNKQYKDCMETFILDLVLQTLKKLPFRCCIAKQRKGSSKWSQLKNLT